MRPKPLIPTLIGIPLSYKGEVFEDRRAIGADDG